MMLMISQSYILWKCLHQTFPKLIHLLDILPKNSVLPSLLTIFPSHFTKIKITCTMITLQNLKKVNFKNLFLNNPNNRFLEKQFLVEITLYFAWEKVFECSVGISRHVLSWHSF